MTTHPVVINNAQIQEIYTRYIGDEKKVEGEYIPNGENAAPKFDPRAWQKESEIFTGVLCNKILPAWNIPLEDQEEFASGLSRYVSEKFPNSLSDKIETWPSWMRVLYDLGGILKHGVDAETFTMKPRHEKDITPDNNESGEPYQQPEKPTGNFTTDA